MRRGPRLALAILLIMGCEGARQPTEPRPGADALTRAPVPGPYTEPARTASASVRACPQGVPIRANAYVLLIPGAHQETICSTDGRPTGPEGLTHNHVLGAAPGSPNYNAHFRLVLVGPGPNYPGASSADAFNSEATVLAGIAAGELVVLDPDAAHVHWVVLTDKSAVVASTLAAVHELSRYASAAITS